MKIDSDRVRKGALGLVGALFMAGALAANIPGVRAPLGVLRLWNDWDMFVAPASPSIPVVVGKPRDGGDDVVIVNPVDRSRPFLERLHGARDDKLHEAMGKSTVPVAIKHRYLDHVCSETQGRYAHVALRMWSRNGKLGLPIAERPCK